MKYFKGLSLLLSVLLVLTFGTLAFSQEKGKIEIFSWWTAGGEAEGLQALFDIYSKLYPDVEIINATVAGGGRNQCQSGIENQNVRRRPT